MDRMVLAIDFNNTVFASYYGEKLINSKGQNVNAIRGFFTKMSMLVNIFDPDIIVMAGDASREMTFRRQMFPQYKAQRKEHDPDIMKQMSIIRKLVALLGFPIIYSPQFEADDILGMMSRFYEDQGDTVVIISSDRDMYQLITDNTFVLSPRGNDLIDKNYMMEHYQLTPDQWIELKILQGDRSDNIPGIPGIGEKTALELMHQYGSIENIYANIYEHKQKIQQLLLTNKDVIPLTRTLVTILTDYKSYDFDISQLDRRPFYLGLFVEEAIANEVPSIVQTVQNLLPYTESTKLAVTYDPNKQEEFITFEEAHHDTSKDDKESS